MFTGPQDRSLLPLQPSHQHLQHLGPCDHAVQTVVTSATVHKPREFKSLCARSAGPSCPYCAGWVAVEAQHCTVILQQIHNIACYLACTAHASAGGKLGVTTHCSTLGLGLVAGWRLPHCVHYHRVFVASAVAGLGWCAGWMWLPRWPESD